MLGMATSAETFRGFGILTNTRGGDSFPPAPAEEPIWIVEACAVLGGYPTRTAEVRLAFLHADEVERGREEMDENCRRVASL